MSTYGRHQCPFRLIGLDSCAIILSCHCYISSPLIYLCVPLFLLRCIFFLQVEHHPIMFPFLVSSIMLTPFFLMVVLSWVSPIMSPFYRSLDTIKSLLTAWGKYRNLVSFTVYPSCIFIFTNTFRYHLIFWPFPTATLISHFLHMSCLSSCMLCAVMHHCLPTIIVCLLPCYLLTSPHNVSPTNRLSIS